MECSAIFTLAKLKGLRSGAILAVDCNIKKGIKKGERRMFEEMFTFSVETLILIFWAMIIALFTLGALWAKYSPKSNSRAVL